MRKSVNDKLTTLYHRATKTFLSTSSLPAAYAGPFLISPPEGYLELRTKWMYIGQETKGNWSSLRYQDDVSKLMNLYADFNLAKTYPGRRSPFWTFGHSLDIRLNPSGPEHSFIWDNLARVGYSDPKKRGRVPEKQLEFWSEYKILSKEIRVLSPDLVLFVTGRYDDLIEKEFPGIELDPLLPEHPICRLHHPALPTLSFRSYHPKFLQMKKLKSKVVDYILQAVNAQGVLK